MELLLLLSVLLLQIQSPLAKLQCPNCGSNAVPYPFSTRAGCGDPLYKITCKAGMLWFNALNGSTNMITSIDPTNQRLIVKPPGFARDGACLAADMKSKGIQLNPNLPFNITASNTIITLNCTTKVIEDGAFDCSPTNVCHRYIKENAMAWSSCKSVPRCCWFKTGGSVNAYKVYRARQEKCSAYMSFVNLNMSLPVSKWPGPAVEIEWILPREPVCEVNGDCKGLLNSRCLVNEGGFGLSKRRCFCKVGFRWDPVNGICQDVKCTHKKGCTHRKNNVHIIGGLAFGLCVIVSLGSVARVIVYRQQNQTSDNSSLSKTQKDLIKANSGRLERIFTSKQITKATNNFSNQNLLGVGGFGEVFKGVLEDGTLIAVKRAKPGNTKGIDQIINEVRILCQVNHKNLVKLLGCCLEFDLPILIYEFIHNGTLFEHLHGTYNPLTWRRRLCIAHQTAQALSYLHSSARQAIFHRDVKSTNILLDETLDVKVSDFGLSRLGVSDMSHVTTSAQGTLGYLDPEYYVNFQLTDKSDVYSFGVVLLELLTSKKAIDFSREDDDVNLVLLVRRGLREEKLMEVIDAAVKEGASNVELETMKLLGILALACLSEKRHNRPLMQEVAKEITSIMSLVTSDF